MPGQTFCLKCGAPITDNKNALDDYDEYDDYDDYDQGAGIGEIDVPYNDEEALISGDTEQLDDLSSGNFNKLRSRESYQTANVVNNRYNNSFDEETDIDDYDDYDDFDDDYDDFNESKKNNRRSNTGGRNGSRNKNNGRREGGRRNPDRDDSSKPSKNSKKKKSGILSNKFFQALLVLLGILALAGVVYFASTSIIKNSNNEDFDLYYEKGQTYEDGEDYVAAINMYLKAKNFAMKKEQQIKAYEGILRCHQQTEGSEAEQIKVLQKLISIDDSNASYYESLILLYQNTGNADKIQELIDSATNEDVKKALSNFDASAPVPSIEPGIYNKAISVSLSAPEGSTIYYTLDESDPTTASDVYESKFKFKKNGTYVIKAFAVNESGNASQTLEAEYVISKGTVDDPKVTPESGEYSERQQIKVEIPEGVSIYYTDDGTDPNKKSTKYSKKTKIFTPEGNNIYKFIAYNEGGVASDIVTMIYAYTPEFAYSYDEAVNLLKSDLLSEGDIESTDLYEEDGSYTTITYLDLAKKEKSSSEENGVEYNYYYIMEAEKHDKDGGTVFDKTFAVNCDSGKISDASKNGSSYTIN